jgi:hypothetical protein
MAVTDKLGRSTFHNIAPQQGVRPTNREIRWLKHIERHGPQSSQYLFGLTRDTHRCKDTALRQMQRLRAGGFLRLPGQQRAIEHADFNPYIYDLTKAATDFLFDRELEESTIRPTGHWWHGYTTSCITSSIDIAAARQGVMFIPAHVILARNDASYEIPLKSGKLVSDQLFALDYGGSYRAFMLEVDRGTEPMNSKAARKSLGRSVQQYADVIENSLHSQHYGLKMNILNLWVFTSRTRQSNFLQLLEACSERVRQSVLTTVIDPGSIGRTIDTTLFEGQWQRSRVSPFKICS